MAIAAFAVASQSIAAAQPTKNVLLVTGQDHPGHKWRETAPVLEKAIAADPRLRVTVAEDPAALASALDQYDVIVLHFMNWEQPDPGEKARDNLRRFVDGGKGLVIVHFGIGAFQGWPEFRDIAGRVWDPKMRAHDPIGKFRVEIKQPDNPIMNGMQSFETTDELYTCLAGDKPIDVLATAKSAVDGKEYNMAFTLNYGKGRVFSSVLGHDVTAFSEPVRQLFQRGVAWAAGLPPVPEK
jgi:type 1 glutamine amidotransferase